MEILFNRRHGISRETERGRLKNALDSAFFNQNLRRFDMEENMEPVKSVKIYLNNADEVW